MGFFIKLNNCCCCFNLRAGSLVILWMRLILSILMLGAIISDKYTLVDYQKNSYTVELSMAFKYIVLAFVIILEMVACILGLYAIYKGKPAYLRFYLVLTFIYLICLLLCIVALICVSLFCDEEMSNKIYKFKKNSSGEINQSTRSTTTSLVLNIFFQFLWNWYFASVVYSYYLHMKRGMPSAHHEMGEKPPSSPSREHKEPQPAA